MTIDATAGTFRLRYSAGPFQLSSTIPFDASAAELRSALEAMTSSSPAPQNMWVGPGDLSVTGADGGPWEIEFTGENADVDMNEFRIASSTLSGGAGATVETIQPGGDFEVCDAAQGDVCRSGQVGAEEGHLDAPSLSVDQSGDIWALAWKELRLQKFSPEGDFLLMVGGEVNKTKVAEREEQEENAEPVTITEAEENLCTAASEDQCGAATSGSGQGQFKALGIGNPIATGPTGTIYVGDEDRIQEFDEEGSYLGEIPLAGAGVTRSLTVTPDGRIYVLSEDVLVKVSRGQEGPGVDSRVVREIGPSGEELAKIQGEWQGRKTPKDPAVLASDAEGNVYVLGTVVYDVPVKPGEEPKWEEVEEALAFNDEGDFYSFEPGQAGFGAPSDTSDLVAIATNVAGPGAEAPGPVFIAHFDSGGPGSIGGPKSYVRGFGQFGDPEPKPPVIASQYATTVAVADASLEGRINPRFAKDTTFWVEYGVGECDKGGCEQSTAREPLGGQANDLAQGTGEVTLTGLSPGTTYHYRFVSESEGGGPVLGAEATFTTYSNPTQTACANDALRIGAGALLPDCRAYEMVSPIDKKGGETIALRDTPGFAVELTQGALDGEKLTYSSYRAFADPESAPYTSQYLAKRGGGGWTNQSISPPRERGVAVDLRNQYKLFSSDLDLAWLQTDSEPVLAPGGLAGYRNLYQRDNESGDYLAQCATEPPGVSAVDFQMEAQGVSKDGSHLVFRATGKLTANAAETAAAQLYECVDGEDLRLVSIVGGEAVGGGASAGSNASTIGDFGPRTGNVIGAISSDGSRIFWTAATGPGPLHARIDGTTTVTIAASGARFRQASSDGTRVIYTVGDQLRAAVVGSESASVDVVAGEVQGVMGASEDVELLYFVSREDLDGEGPAKAGEPNLYLHRAGPDVYEFVAALSEDDAREEVPGSEETPVLTPVARYPYARSSRVSADGLHAAFTSTARLTGYDNTDLASEEADAEVFLYDVEADDLRCISCNPSGARPRGAEVGKPSFWAAAMIPGWQDQFHASRALAEDGGRLFFEAVDPLALGDTNGMIDVYQWEVPGRGGCGTDSASYSEPAGGCVELISSGKSPEPSTLVDASAEGDDVFFKTASSLWGPDPGLVDIYDARVGGGFPSPVPPPGPCEGEACQSPAAAPEFPTPGSSSYKGPSSSSEDKARRCANGKAKRFANRAKRLRRVSKRVDGLRKKRRLRRRAARNAKRAKRLSRKATRCRRANRRAAR